MKTVTKMLQVLRLGRAKGNYLFNPFADWKILAVGFVLFNTLLVFFSAFLFFEIRQGEIFEVEDVKEITVESIDRKALADALSVVAEKERLYEEVRSARPKFVDPAR